jgi:hypothetical protein
MHRSDPKGASFAEVERAEIGLTQPRRVRQHGSEHRLQVARRARDNLQHPRRSGLLLQRVSKELSRLGEFSGSLVKLGLEVGCGGNATARRCRLLPALNLRWLLTVRFHSYATRGRGASTGGPATNAIDLTSGQPLMKPSHDVQDHAKGRQGYHSRADVKRGLDEAQRARPQCTIPAPLRSEMGLVSRVSPVQTALRNYTRDEGRSFEVGNQVLISSHRKLLLSKAMVVNVAEKPGQDSGRQG